jgi:hypothetical protein
VQRVCQKCANFSGSLRKVPFVAVMWTNMSVGHPLF